MKLQAGHKAGQQAGRPLKRLLGYSRSTGPAAPVRRSRISRIVICIVALATTTAHGGSDDDPLLHGGIPGVGKAAKVEGTGDNESVLRGGAGSPNKTKKIGDPGDRSDDSDPLLLGGVPGLK
jgi:hypothetical protein